MELKVRSAAPPVYRSENLRAVAMPLGGIGTGSVAICGDGSLRQWQLCNNVNHLAFVPHSFFAVRAHKQGSDPVSRVLQSGALYKENFEPIPSVNDYVIPDECRQLLNELPGVQSTEFIGEYPIAEIQYLDDGLPLEISLTAYSPFCPLDAAASGLPAVIFRFTAKNAGDKPVDAHIVGTLQNFIGWDGIRAISGVESADYGGGQNYALRLRGMHAVVMENSRLAPNHPQNGSLCLAALQDGVEICPAWDDLRSFWQEFTRDGLSHASQNSSTSADGRTYNGAISVAIRCEPGESKTVTFVLAWHFPNRYVSWGQWFSKIEDKKSLFWQGNAYNTRFAGAASVAEYVRDNFNQLDETTQLFRKTFFDSTLPYELLDVVSSQMSVIRTPTCLWTEDGRFHAFEGCGGASTGGWLATGGCCPMNCTHVFAYEWALSAVFPDLERTMRETELFHQLHSTGYLPHRVTLPLYLPRPWEHDLGGPEKPALDGLLSMVLKTYREHRRNADSEWLKRAWPKIKSAMQHVMMVHDVDGDGVIKGEQPNTYDISIYGPNTFIGTLYMAALRASEEMAKLQDEPVLASEYRDWFEKAKKGYDDLLWNGEYWIQIYDSEQNPEQNYGMGCHSDHLFGQWWAFNLGLGWLLPPERVKQAMESIVKYNLRDNFTGHKQIPRVFASDDEAGLLICSWPQGGRPEVPTLYSDEIWTGIEYEVAALCIYNGLIEDGLKILRAVRNRYNGARRNPWNDVECGDHYARAMSSWALLDAACGYQYDASKGSMTIDPRIWDGQNFRAFFITASSWGTAEIRTNAGWHVVKFTPKWGELILESLTVRGVNASKISIHLGENEIPADIVTSDDLVIIHFQDAQHIPAGSDLEVNLTLTPKQA